MIADANGDCFLTRIQVRETSDLSLLDLEVQPLLEFADGLHPTVCAEQRVFI